MVFTLDSDVSVIMESKTTPSHTPPSLKQGPNQAYYGLSRELIFGPFFGPGAVGWGSIGLDDVPRALGESKK